MCCSLLEFLAQHSTSPPLLTAKPSFNQSQKYKEKRKSFANTVLFQILLLFQIFIDLFYFISVLKPENFKQTIAISSAKRKKKNSNMETDHYFCITLHPSWFINNIKSCICHIPPWKTVTETGKISHLRPHSNVAAQPKSECSIQMLNYW